MLSKTPKQKTKTSKQQGSKRGTRTTAAKVKKNPAKKAARQDSAPPALRPPQRAILVDIENTSKEVDLIRVIEGLKIDRAAQPTQLAAVGNWRSVGQPLARRLAALGTQLVHSAPVRGVRDWSDLWIAVAAGCWLGTAAAGDILEIVSDDRAFDAVGDAAAARGVSFHRISYRKTLGSAEKAPSVGTKARRSHRGGRSRRRTDQLPATPAEATTFTRSARAQTSPAQAVAGTDSYGASDEQIKAVMARLTGAHPDRWVNLDVLETALKAEGFTRPPGSLRLVTRLRRLKDFEVSANGTVRMSPTPPRLGAARTQGLSSTDGVPIVEED